jgi:serine/threonine protein kinase
MADFDLAPLVDLRGHPNVVNVEEVLDSDGTLAIVMEYAPGGSVGELLRTRGGTLGFAETLLVAEHTSAALAAAHDRDIIDRDIEPHNLLIGAFGQVKVCDFGIAALTRSDEVSNRTNSLSLRYASPEELRGEEEIGPAADVHSLAATVHQLLTGEYLPAPDGTRCDADADATEPTVAGEPALRTFDRATVEVAGLFDEPVTVSTWRYVFAFDPRSVLLFTFSSPNPDLDDLFEDHFEAIMSGVRIGPSTPTDDDPGSGAPR